MKRIKYPFVLLPFQFDWVCDDAWKPAFTQSVFYIGAVCGTLVFGWVSDHYGRYASFIASNSIILVAGIATPFAFDFISFLLCRFVMGLSFMTFFLALFMLSTYTLIFDIFTSFSQIFFFYSNGIRSLRT